MGNRADTWMPLFIGDYLGDTARLSTEQHGAYLLLIFDYWRNGPPNDDDDDLAAVAKLDIETWKKHRPKLQRFFRVADGLWRHKRIDREIEAAQAHADKASERAAAAAAARWGRERQGQDAPGNATRTAASSPSSNASSKPAAKPEECPSPSPSPSEPNGSSESDANASLSRRSRPSEEFEAIWLAYPHVKGRSSKRKSLAEWGKLSAAIRRVLPAAVQRYRAEGREPKEDCGAAALERWLRDERYLDWLPVTEVAKTRTPEEQATFEAKMAAYVERQAAAQEASHG